MAWEVDPRAPFWKLVRPLCALLFLALGAYLVRGLADGALEYGSCPGRMSRNCNVERLTSPTALALGTLHIASLLLAFAATAIRPAWFFRRPVLIATAATLVGSYLMLVAITAYR